MPRGAGRRRASRGGELLKQVAHGIADPRVNEGAPADLATQAVTWPGPAHDHSNVFPELVRLLAHGRSISLAQSTDIPVITLLRNVPAVHRTFRTVEGGAATF